MTLLNRPAKAKSKPANVVAPSQSQSTPIQSSAPVITHEMIAQRAYEIWVRKGKPESHCVANWQEAEAEIKKIA